MNISETGLNNLLKWHFDQDEFYPDQKEIILSILSGKNVLALTGNMQQPSLCYRLPAMILENITLVITQAKQITEMNNNVSLPEVYIYNSISEGNIRKVLQNILDRKYKLVYLNPEQLQNGVFISTIASVPISLIVIEDAECISPYSYDFRPEYMDICKFIKEIDFQKNIMAMTKVCPLNLRNEIISRLNIRNPEIFISDLSLNDTSLEVIKSFSHEEKYSILKSIISGLSGQAVIYTNYINKAIEICEFISKFNIQVAYYHGGLTRDNREQIERKFKYGMIKVVVATNCFSIDPSISSISYVIHFDMPDGLERYYKQISNLRKIRSILIYSPSDRNFHHSIIEREVTSLSDIWRITDFLKRCSKNISSDLTMIDQKKHEQSLSIKKWLEEHFHSLSPSAQKELIGLKIRHEEADDIDKNPYNFLEYNRYLDSEHWKNFRKEILGTYKKCYICENKAEQVHHLHYRTLRMEKPDDVLALCKKCHCFIHPDGELTINIFNEIADNEKKQLKLSEVRYPETFVSYEQMGIETNLNQYELKKALRLMEIAGMLIIQPDFFTTDKVLEHICDIEYSSISKGITLQLKDLDILITDDLFESIKKVRYDSIKKVEEYVNTQECRQKFICEYFSEDIYDACQKCDNCKNANKFCNKDNPSIPYFVRAILEFVNGHDGELSKKKLAEILAKKWQNMTKFEKWEEFSALSMLKIEEIILIIDLLIGYGLLEEEDYKVKLAETGFNVLNNDSSFLALSLVARLAEDMKHFRSSIMSKIIPKAKGISDGKQIINAELNEHDKAQVAVLKCAGKTDGQINRSDMLNILKGQKTKKIAKYNFDHLEEFSSLRNLNRETILRYIDELIESGCLKLDSLFFPKIQITDAGRRRLSKLSK